MRPLPANQETLGIARRVVWFEPPEVALSNPVRFLAYAFRYASHPDMRTLRAYVSDAELSEALEHAPPGIIDDRSWAYWRLMLDLPPRRPPVRSIA